MFATITYYLFVLLFWLFELKFDFTFAPIHEQIPKLIQKRRVSVKLKLKEHL